jgi:hypothetical protein
LESALTILKRQRETWREEKKMGGEEGEIQDERRRRGRAAQTPVERNWYQQRRLGRTISWEGKRSSSSDSAR